MSDVASTELDRRGRRVQLETLEAVQRAGAATAAEVAAALGGDPESVARRLRRYRRRGWLAVEYGEDGPEYSVREAGATRMKWIRARCHRTPSETTVRA